MLFNSYAFLFAFLPVALLGYEIAGRFHRRAVVAWLGLVSLAFYAYWHPPFVIVLLSSIAINYTAAALISGTIKNPVDSRVWLWAAIAINLGTLGYFKYLFAFLNFAGHLVGSTTHWSNVLLPLGISFFTFTQIAYLVDLQQGTATFQDISSYVLFVTFFPHLIAGPILHHKQMMPQFQEARDYRLRLDDLAVGFSWFIMGLGKKVLLADTFAVTANLGYGAPGPLGLLLAWRGVLAYALQLYFDFSGYSDMALGLARMFSINFPLNFSSPYKAPNIIQYWERWHITLTEYINAYLFSPLQFWVSARRQSQGKKVSRKAMATPGGFASMVAFPMFFTMSIAGLWHGAGLKYIVFGLLHATYLTTNHAWKMFRHKSAAEIAAAPPPSAFSKTVGHVSAVAVTFLAVLVAQTFFRGNSCRHALSLLGGMAGVHGIGAHLFAGENTAAAALTVAEMLAGFFIVWALPNTQQLLSRFKPALGETVWDTATMPKRFLWRPNMGWALAAACVLFFSLVHLQDPSTFLYFQF
jgi:D-alanyl-lipoteichoic acid acyltransferase DltB (MBOAT superfamily)